MGRRPAPRAAWRRCPLRNRWTRARSRVVERGESQRIHQCDGARPHGEDIADDAADAGRRALVWLDGGRVIVALDTNGDRETVTDVDDAGTFTGADENPWCLRRET